MKQIMIITVLCSVVSMGLFAQNEGTPIANTQSPIANTPTLPEEASIHFVSPVWGVTPGQSLVMYKDGLVVGGGIIQ